MTDEPAFVRAAQAQPDDDTIRLVYADWLDEQGGAARETHAAFVRLQVQRSRLDVSDPDRAGLLAEEARLVQKYKRDWNGRVHRELHRRSVFELVDARRGLIRGWDYHRGMIARVSFEPAALSWHADVVASLGPVQGVEVVGPHDWSNTDRRELAALFGTVKLVRLRSQGWTGNALTAVSGFPHATIFDLRGVLGVPPNLRDLEARARHGELPPVVLFRQAVNVPNPARAGFTSSDSHNPVHVIDPHNKWAAVRPWFADFTGEVLDPIRYQGTSR